MARKQSRLKARTYRLDIGRLAAIARIQKSLPVRPTETALIEKAIDLLIAHFAERKGHG